MTYFDPSESIRGIQQLLVSDKKRIAFLFGAGTSLATKSDKSLKIPAITEMTECIVKEIEKDNKLKIAITEIKEEIENTKKDFNIETLLSNIEEKINIIGKGQLNGLNKDELDKLDNSIREKIHAIVSVHKEIEKLQKTGDILGYKETLKDMVQNDFASWISSADRKYAVEIFTTNYDYLFEIGLENNNVPYYDGFTGSYKPFFNADSLEDLDLDSDFFNKQTKLWKIHGSIGLHQDEVTGKIIRSNSDSGDLLIYPSSMKYNNSKKQPYTAFMDRLNGYLKHDDAVLFVCGYSFGDEHINERIISALKSNTSAHVFVLNYDIIWENEQKKYSFTEDSSLAEIAKNNRKISILSSRTAVIGSKFRTWKLKKEPDKADSVNVNWYFDEDAPTNENDPLNSEQKGLEEWTGEGEFIIPNFVKFTNFLKEMLPKEDWMVQKDE